MFRFFDPKKEFNFVRYFPASLWVSAAIPLIALLAFALGGLNWGIDFAGGTEMQIQFQKETPAEAIRKVLTDLKFGKNQVQRYGSLESSEMLIRVERRTAFNSEDAAHIQQVLTQHLSTSDVQVTFKEEMGDRMSIRLPLPPIAAKNTDPQALAEAIKVQQQNLIEALNQKSGFKIREGNAVLRDTSNQGQITYNVQFGGVSDTIAQALSKQFGEVKVRRTDFVDSQVSKQLRTDGALAILYALLAILIYIIIRFDILFAPGAIVALLQDTFGAFLIFTLARYEFDLPSVAALLTVVGVSINNTIVVYDRIRETLPRGHKKEEEMDEEKVVACVNKAVNDTLSRTINTTLTTLFSTVSLWLFAGGTLESFAAALTVGLALGAFSSTFAAPAAYLFMRRWFAKNQFRTHAGNKHGFSREEKARGIV